MKKILVIITLVVFLIPFQSLRAQNTTRHVVTDFYYGYSILASKVDFTYNGSQIDLFRDKFGPVGGRAEYIFESGLGQGGVGIGLEANYRKNNHELDYISFVDSLAYHASKKSTQIRIMARLSYHFVYQENLDAYIGLAGGYVKRDFSLESDELDFNFDLSNYIEFPVAARAYIGGRYFFIPNVGINFEMGVGGGSFVTGGISFSI